MKHWKVAAIAIALVACISVVVYSHCHDTYPYEEVQDYVVKNKYWRDPMGESPITVEFLINPIQSGQPNLTNDIKAAAELWSDIEINDDHTIPFRFSHEGQTLLPVNPNVPDSKNIVGWY